ncbi:MAG: carbohydrate ABC transporter permease [Clostridia bacterium]|nr:carbohydrate ABC transporter permease [Clostridia bacterium]
MTKKENKSTGLKKAEKKRQFILSFMFVIICAIILFPFLLLVSVSLSDEKDIVFNGYNIIPRVFSTNAYKYVFKNPTSILNAYKVTIFYSVVTMVLNTLVMALIAYPLSRKELKGRKGMSFYLYFTTLFSGGLIPTFILNTQYLHLGDTMWIYILPGMVSVWHVFMLRAFIQGIPNEIVESLRIDGASEYRIFFGTIIPLSKPVIATVMLFTFLNKWNDWMTSMLYINDQKLISLQYLLQRIMLNVQLLQQSQQAGTSDMIDATQLPTETVRMAMAVAVAGPALLVFPFFQKYFTKGLTVGSVKG